MPVPYDHYCYSNRYSFWFPRFDLRPFYTTTNIPNLVGTGHMSLLLVPGTQVDIWYSTCPLGPNGMWHTVLCCCRDNGDGEYLFLFLNDSPEIQWGSDRAYYDCACMNISWITYRNDLSLRVSPSGIQISFTVQEVASVPY